ncbi:MAG: polyribonucleotide nucleotidyltransferase [Candidatus Kerfeldbacteria bacterium RIFOXYA2_FULL_38_24]|uniref:Polyribonucleotide nucleotidyltransferase n=1 Tax=Candidatus Kerfeldbacteria bacterium RIFOXYB2_FULL_38_14 TaxID=1798547 RepID=A0A1G2BE27_9BACT|nr:MAG: polyribonucleotide nucleotidyltransferase [Candidatus Kerfeldbacteria bacterium RIFOXYA2_FULL_38_24]OGY86936.1 MAG: polyribonucleotide nucleotidyltransferase [Candidatus Kerfeldbacteria bacterium RIFOXYB2_FULL_38_14]
MSEVKTYKTEWGGKTLTIETGKLAQLAGGSCKVQYGETVVLATATIAKNIREGLDYFPLMVDYEEKLYAAGKIKGSRFIKREGRPSDQAVLSARITDRSLRPLFDDHIRNDVQVVLSVLSVDQVNDPAFVALIAASCAVSISNIPWDGPIAGLTVAYLDGAYILNPTPEQRVKSELFLLMAVREEQIVMIEAEGNEANEEITFGGLEFGLKSGQPVIELIKQVIKEVGQEKIQATTAKLTAEEQKMYDLVEQKAQDFFQKNIDSLFGIRGKSDRQEKEDKTKEELLAMLETEEEKAIALKLFAKYYEEAFRTNMLEKEVRVDGRKLEEVRSLSCEVDILPRTHGSAIFQRGETQVLSTVTLGAPGDAQIIDGIEPEYTKRYMHHYNFPPFSVGEVKPMRGPSRRDIGHGMLAEKALEKMIPDKEVFPYTIRVVSDVLMSNGSSSQASACGSTMSLMAAGVPLKNMVAGIAMGLVTTPDRSQYKILTDIQGIEDHSGDMDFKVAGTKNGITAIQLDIKLGGITLEICQDTLAQAKKARLFILEEMRKAIAEPRKELSPYAPRIEVIHVDPEKIGDIIGPGGKIINKIIEETEVQIDIEDDGTVFITAVNNEGMKKAKEQIAQIVREIAVGEVYEGKVLQIVKDRNSGSEIGAIVDLGGGKDGMVHISNVCHCRIAKVSDVLHVDDLVKVKVVEIDKERGRIGLSRKDLISPTDVDALCQGVATAAPAIRRGFSANGRNGRNNGYPKRDFRN